MKRTRTQRKNYMLLVGVSLSLAVLCSGMEGATINSHYGQPISFNSIVYSHSLVDVDGIAFMLGNAKNDKTNTDTSTTTDTTTTTTTTTKKKGGKKIFSDQKNSTSRRRAIIDD